MSPLVLVRGGSKVKVEFKMVESGLKGLMTSCAQ
jgi:hypothetical protein